MRALGVLLAGRLTLSVVLCSPLFCTAAEPAGADGLRSLLLTGEDRGPHAAGLALRRYQAVRTVRTDGAAEYAYAIVLSRLNKPKDALDVLGQAVERPPRPYLAAAKAQAGLQLQQKQWASAAGRLDQFAKWLAEKPDLWDAAESRQADARWLGRAVSVAQLVSTSAADVDRFAELDQQLRTRLPVALAEAYTAGFDAVVTESEALATQEEAAAKAARIAQQAQRDDARAKTKKWDPLESTCRHASLSIL